MHSISHILAYLMLWNFIALIGVYAEDQLIEVGKIHLCNHILSELDLLKANDELMRVRFELLYKSLDEMTRAFESRVHELRIKLDATDKANIGMNGETQKLLKEQYNELEQQLQENARKSEETAISMNHKIAELQQHLSIRLEANIEKSTQFKEDQVKMLNQSIKKIDNNDEHILKLLNDVVKRSDRGTWQEIKDKLSPLQNISNILNQHDKAIERVHRNITLFTTTKFENIEQKLEEFKNAKSVILQDNRNILKELTRRLESKNVMYFKDSGLNDFLSDEPTICIVSEDRKLLCNSESFPLNCLKYNPAFCKGNICRIKYPKRSGESFLVMCEDKIEGGGWTLMQRRINGSVDFYRDWLEYKNGFGNIEGEFWLGLEKLHALTSTQGPHELLIELQDFDNVTKYAKYNSFLVGSESENYKLLDVGTYSGNAGNSFSWHKGYEFTTKDRDHDKSTNHNCAQNKHGAWWYENCQWSNLNGLYYSTGQVDKERTGTGLNWGEFHGFDYSMKSVRMMIRPKYN